VAGLLSLGPGSLYRPSALVKPRACGADDDDSYLFALPVLTALAPCGRRRWSNPRVVSSPW
jgi:hypothetical protein